MVGTMALAEAHGGSGDAAKGERVFRKCMACHAVGEGAKNKVGPELNGVVGRAAASVEDFKYSPAMQEKGEGGLVWDAGTLDAFLTNPKDYVPGTKMAFPGLKKDGERADVIAYLATFTE
nr:cytochrome c family protein [Kandeliimicrobium roseum]